MWLLATSGLKADGQPPAATTLMLASDTAAAQVQTLVHLTAALGTPAATVTGSIVFLDNGQPLAAVPLTAQKIAVLSIASLAQGTHTLTAQYAGDAANGATSSAAVTVAVSPLPAAFSIGTVTATTYVGTPITISTAGLPSRASGSVSFMDASATVATSAISGVSTPAYQAFGDSITYGVGLSQASRYVNLVAANFGLALNDLGFPGSQVCDMLPFQILPNGLGPTQASAPLTSLMIGTNDVNDHFQQNYEAIFRACHQADLAWLAIPREYKVLPGDEGATTLGGAWSSSTSGFDQSTYGTLFNSTGNGTARFAITSAGAPIYLWYLVGDHLTGGFTLAIDGASTQVTYPTQLWPGSGSLIPMNPQSIGYALLRLPVAAGPHVVDVTVQSGSVGILGVATPPSPGGASVHPTVLVTDVLNQLMNNPVAPPSAIAQFTQYLQADVALLESDGLDVRFVPTETYMLGTAAEMFDQVHPNELGDAHLATAFEAILNNVPTAPFATFVNTAPAASVTFATPGTHVVTAAYSGDTVYAASAASPLSINVLPQTISTTTLSAPATRYLGGTPVTFTAVVTPAGAGGTVTFYDGTAVLAQTTLSGGAASFTSSTLALGLHNVTASYSGDAPDTPSASAVLTVQIGIYPATLTLAPVPVSISFGTAQMLTATANPGVATGTVTFIDSFTAAGQTVPQVMTLGQASLGGGVATLSANGLLVGSHSFTAQYAGDMFDAAATSAPVTMQVLALATGTSIVESASTLSYGMAEMLTASVVPSDATGTMTFHDSAGVLGQVTLAGGSASVTTTTLTPGSHSFYVMYSGDGTHAASTSSSVSSQVDPAVSSIVLAPVVSAYAGNPVVFTATITPASATGTVVFHDASSGNLGEANVIQGVASLHLGSLAPGAYVITASYGGDALDGPSMSAAMTLQVTLNPTTTAISLRPASAVFGTAVTLAAAVSPATASGEVTFTDASTGVLATAVVAGGAASLTLTSQMGASLGIGTHTIRASYSGDSLNAASSSAPALLTITPDATATTLTLAQVSVPVGSVVTFNVRVTCAAANVPAGTVTIRSGSTVLASAAVSNATAGVGYATLSANTTALGLGTFPAVAYYSGDADDAASDSSSAPVSFVVTAIPTTTVLTVSAAQVVVHGPVMFSASVASGGATPTGTVTFLEAGSVLATVALEASGMATATLPAAQVGAWSISANYTPTGLFAASSAAAQTLSVTLPVAIALSPNPISATAGSATNVSLSITPLSGYSGAIASQCLPSVSFVTCAVDAPPSISGVTPVSGSLRVTIAKSTAAAAAKQRPGAGAQGVAWLALVLPMMAAARRRRRAMAGVRLGVALLAVAGAAFSLAGCGEGGTFFNIPAGTQTVQVTVTAAGSAVSANLVVNITD